MNISKCFKGDRWTVRNYFGVLSLTEEFLASSLLSFHSISPLDIFWTLLRKWSYETNRIDICFHLCSIATLKWMYRTIGMISGKSLMKYEYTTRIFILKIRQPCSILRCWRNKCYIPLTNEGSQLARLNLRSPIKLSNIIQIPTSHRLSVSWYKVHPLYTPLININGWNPI